MILKPYQLRTLEFNEETQCLMDGNDLVCLEKRDNPEDNPSLDEVLTPKVISHVNLKYNVVKEHYEMDCDEVKVIREPRNQKDEIWF